MLRHGLEVVELIIIIIIDKLLTAYWIAGYWNPKWNVWLEILIYYHAVDTYLRGRYRAMGLHSRIPSVSVFVCQACCMLQELWG